MKPEQVAQAAIAGMLSRRGIIIPGVFNQAISVIGRLAPLPLVYSVVSLFWGRFAQGTEAIA